MMTGAAVHNLHVYISACTSSEAFKEVLDEFTLQIADIPHPYRRIDHARHASTQVNSGDPQRLIHWHQEISGSQNSLLITHSLVERFAQSDANVFNRVMFINLEISIALEIEVECAVPSHKLQHVIEKSDAGANVVGSCAFQCQLQRYPRLVRLALNRGYALLLSRFLRSRLNSHHVVSLSKCLDYFDQLISFRVAAKASSARSICSRVPTVTRTQPSHPGSAERSRTSIPRCFMACTNSLCLLPICVSTKFAWLGHHFTPSPSSPRMNSSRAAHTSLT